jgi:hypothetical protein
MSGINNDMSATSRDAATLAQQAAEGLTNPPGPGAQDEAVQEDADATVVEISDAVPAPTSVKPVPDGDVPADIDEAGALASGLAGQISGSGSQASSAHSPLSPEMALKLTQP